MHLKLTLHLNLYWYTRLRCNYKVFESEITEALFETPINLAKTLFF